MSGFIPELFKVLGKFFVWLFIGIWYIIKGSLFITIYLTYISLMIAVTPLLFFFYWKGIKDIWSNLPKSSEDIWFWFFPEAKKAREKRKQKKELTELEARPASLDYEEAKEKQENEVQKEFTCLSCGTPFSEEMMNATKKTDRLEVYCEFCGHRIELTPEMKT